MTTPLPSYLHATPLECIHVDVVDAAWGEDVSEELADRLNEIATRWCTHNEGDSWSIDWRRPVQGEAQGYYVRLSSGETRILTHPPIELLMITQRAFEHACLVATRESA